ncbi:MAG: hypothetical protein ACLFU9_05605 [Candidatus Bathyarchaeia archaeon]
MSYLWTVGYYVEMGFMVPEDVTTITITKATFPLENSNYFNVEVLNPSYSKADAKIINIALITTSDDKEQIHIIPDELVEPYVPYRLVRGEAVTFRCNRNWGEHAGQNITVAVLVEDGSGATFPYQTSMVRLEIIKTEFNTQVTVSRFNITVRNSPGSPIPLNVTEILLGATSIPPQNITFTDENAKLPQLLEPGQNKTFICEWNLWRNGILGTTYSSHNITAKTLQGYSAVKTITLPPAVMLNITNVAFNVSDNSSFNLTVHSLSTSPHFVSINKVTITNNTEVPENVTVIGNMPRIIFPDQNITLQCLWNWAAYKGQEIKITVHTTPGFYTYKYEMLPAGEEGYFEN